MSLPERVIVGTADPKLLVAGSKETVCSECKGRMWLAPSGQHMMAQGYIPMCSNCALASLDDNDEIAIAPGALDELDGWRKRN